MSYRLICKEILVVGDVAMGVVGGVGSEYMMAGPWSAKVEYLHIMTPTKRVQRGLCSRKSSATQK